MSKMPLRILLMAVAGSVLLVAVLAMFLVLRDDASISAPVGATTTGAASIDPGSDPVTSTTTTSVPSVEGASVNDIAERFRDAVNSRNAESVAEFAPTVPAATLEFLIGGGPYEKVDCYTFDAKDECRVVNGIADFTFVVDTGSESVAAVTYVGGE